MNPLSAALFGIVIAAPAASAPPAVPLAWRLSVAVPPEVRDAAEQEVAVLFRRVGLQAAWTGPEDALPPGALPVVVVESGRSPRLPRRLLGASSLDRGTGVWIFYAAIRRELGGVRDPRLLGRALGRVIVHEVVHAHQVTHQHATAGLMGRQLDARLLIGDEVEWDLASQLAFTGAVTSGATSTAGK